MNTASLLPPQSELDSSHDPFLAATIELERSARVLDLEDWIVERLRHCEQETITNLLLTEEEGRVHSTTGIVIRHCSVAGRPAISFQVSRDAYRNSVCAEAMHNSWLCALYGIRHGGGAAALTVDPQKHNERELQRAVKGFAQSAREVLANAAVLVPSRVHAIEMDWLEAGLEKSADEMPIITGKASEAAPSRIEEFVCGMSELIVRAAGNLKQSVAVQGFDENTRALITHLHHKGARIVAVADESGGLKHDLGLDPAQLEEHVRHHGVLLGYPDGEAVLNVDVLEAECDVLILAGGRGQIQSQNIPLVKARIVVEITPGAVMESAQHQLNSAGKLYISSQLCAGPALLTGLSEAQQITPLSRRLAEMRRKIRTTWKAVAEASERWKVPVADAAHALAVQRVAAILRAQSTPF